jgi:hypothetical protein
MRDSKSKAPLEPTPETKATLKKQNTKVHVTTSDFDVYLHIYKKNKNIETTKDVYL